MKEETHFELLPPALPASADEPALPLTDEQYAILRRIENLARLMDSAVSIPGLNWRVGVDGFVGLLPIVGDAIGAVASGYIVLQAGKLGLPPAKLTRMVSNILVDTGVGFVPFAGDLLDLAVKANLKNADMIRAHFQLPPMPRTWKAPA